MLNQSIPDPANGTFVFSRFVPNAATRGWLRMLGFETYCNSTDGATYPDHKPCRLASPVASIPLKTLEQDPPGLFPSPPFPLFSPFARSLEVGTFICLPFPSFPLHSSSLPSLVLTPVSRGLGVSPRKSFSILCGYRRKLMHFWQNIPLSRRIVLAANSLMIGIFYGQ